MRLWWLVLVTAVLLLTVGRGMAQTGPELMLKPWGEAEAADEKAAPQIELTGEMRYSWDGDVEDSSADFELMRYDADGRYRTTTRRGAPTVGYDVTYMDLDSSAAALPERLVDTSAAVGFGLGQWRDWSLAGTIGGGFAGDTPYSDEDGWYGKASVMGNKKLDERRSLQVGLQYDGNRPIWPDAPLPIVAYNEKVNDSFRYSLGLPLSSVQWKPADRWTFEASTITLFSFNAEARYRMSERVTVFGAYDGETRGFHLEGNQEHRRLLYSERRLEAGVRLRSPKLAAGQLVIAGGYAFDREFERGFDVRDTDTVRDVSDEPYVRAAVELRF